MERLVTKLEIKSLSDGGLEGYGSYFGNVDFGGDIVVKGAFRSTLAEHKASGTMPKMLWMHKPDQVIGKWTEMVEDDKGLYVKGVFAPTQLARETRDLLKMDAIDGLSIGYATKDYAYDKKGNRLLKDLYLSEVSVVSMQMNPLAQVANVKTRTSAKGEYVPTVREFEDFLREAGGYSRKVATTLASRLLRTPEGQGDPELEAMQELLASIRKSEAQIVSEIFRR